MSDGVNCTPSRIIGWFTDSEKCIMHGNITELEVIHRNLTSDQLDELIELGLARANQAGK
jgi:hypothetical protein